MLPLHAAWRITEDGQHRALLDDLEITYAPSAYALAIAGIVPPSVEPSRHQCLLMAMMLPGHLWQDYINGLRGLGHLGAAKGFLFKQNVKIAENQLHRGHSPHNEASPPLNYAMAATKLDHILPIE